MKKSLTFLLASILVIGLIGGPALAKKKKKKPAPAAPVTQTITYEEEGTMTAPAVGNVASAAITETEFAVVNECASMPSSQGFDGHVVEIPAEYLDGNATVSVVGSDATGLYDLNGYFYDEGCNIMEPYLEEGADITGAIPATAKWMVINLSGGAQGAFKLTATNTITVTP